jgi:hypothetical protein
MGGCAGNHIRGYLEGNGQGRDSEGECDPMGGIPIPSAPDVLV